MVEKLRLSVFLRVHPPSHVLLVRCLRIHDIHGLRRPQRLYLHAFAILRLWMEIALFQVAFDVVFLLVLADQVVLLPDGGRLLVLQRALVVVLVVFVLVLDQVRLSGLDQDEFVRLDLRLVRWLDGDQRG